MRILQKKSRSNRGFTLMELSIVILVIGILAALVIPQLVNLRTSTRDQTALTNAKSALAMYQNEKGPDIAPSIVLFVKGQKYFYIFGYNKAEARLRIVPEKYEDFQDFDDINDAVTAIINSELNGEVFKLATTSAVPPEYINVSQTLQKNEKNVIIYEGELINGSLAEPDVTPNATSNIVYTTVFRYSVSNGGIPSTEEAILSSTQVASAHVIPADPMPTDAGYFAYWKLVSVNGTVRDEPAYELYEGAAYLLPNANVVYEAVYMQEVAPQDPETLDYLIYNAEQLRWLASNINSEAIPSTANVKLMRSVKLNDDVLNADNTLNIDAESPEAVIPFTQWTPICNNDGQSYSGTFDGNGHTISGLYINRPLATREGLFGYVDGATFKDLGITDSYINAKVYVGAIAGATVATPANGEVKFLRCYNSGVVLSSAEKTGDMAVDAFLGGIIGWSAGSINFNGCYNSGIVAATADGRYVGGMVGCVTSTSSTLTLNKSYNRGTVTGCSETLACAGGLVGVSYSPLINMSECYNAGAVSAVGTQVGGLIGCVTQAPAASATLTANGCYTVNTSSVSGGQLAGGLVGVIRVTTSTFMSCANNGAVSAITAVDATFTESAVGGIAGACYAGTTVTFDSTNNNGGITNIDSVAGGIAGLTKGTEATFSECANSGVVTAKSNVGGIMGTCSIGIFNVKCCTNSGAVSTSAHISGNINAGGMVGLASGTTSINECKNAGVISAYQSAGGLVGSNSDALLEFWGGVNSGAVTATENNAGGIIGKIAFTCHITSSANMGEVSATGSYTGGIVGCASVVSTDNTIYACYNLSLLQGNTCIGGIAGYASASTTVSYSYNIGLCYATDVSNKLCGGIIGQHSMANGNAVVTDCYYLTGASNAPTMTAGGTAKPKADFSNDAVLNLLNPALTMFSSTHFFSYNLVVSLDPAAVALAPTTVAELIDNLPLILVLHPGAEIDPNAENPA